MPLRFVYDESPSSSFSVIVGEYSLGALLLSKDASEFAYDNGGVEVRGICWKGCTNEPALMPPLPLVATDAPL